MNIASYTDDSATGSADDLLRSSGQVPKFEKYIKRRNF